MVKKIKNTPFWNVLRRGSAATLALIVVAMSCFVPISAADSVSGTDASGLTYEINQGFTATITGIGSYSSNELVIPEYIIHDNRNYRVVAIADFAFKGNLNLVSVDLNLVTLVGSSAFANCTSLRQVGGIGPFHVSENGFSGCTSFSNMSWSSLASFDVGAFYNCPFVEADFRRLFPGTVVPLANFGSSSLKTVRYGTNIYLNGSLKSSVINIYYSGSLVDYVQSVRCESGNFINNRSAKLYINDVLVSGTLVLPEGVPVGMCFGGYNGYDTLIVPKGTVFADNGGTRRWFFVNVNLKNVYWYSSDVSGISSTTAVNQAPLNGCTGLQNVYYYGATRSIDYNGTFYNTNDTFTLHLTAYQANYNLTGFSNPVTYNNHYVVLDLVGVSVSDNQEILHYTDTFSVTFTPDLNYQLPFAVIVTDPFGNSLPWTNGVEYFYDSDTGVFTILSDYRNIAIRVVGVPYIDGAYQEGYNAGFINGEASGYENGYNTGNSDGYQNGFNVGNSLGYNNGLAVGYENGYSDGYDEGSTVGSEDAYGFGYSKGYDDGFEDGRDVGYGEGYDVGYNAGYNAGYADGSSGAGSGSGSSSADSVLAFATYRLDLVRNGQVVHSMNVTPQYNLGSVYFGTLDIVNAIYDYEEANGDLDYVNVVCTWADSDSFDFGQFPLYVAGTSLVESGSLLTLDEVSLSLSAPWVDGSSSESLRRFEITSSEIPTVTLVKSVSIHVGRATDLLKEFTLCTSTYFYNQGYNDGYTTGYGVGSSESRIESYNTGYHNGFIEGKSEGITMAEKGNFYNLFFSVSDAVYSNFLNLLNFEVLGVNMKVVFGSFLTVCLVLIVVFKFTGKS